MKKTLAAFLTIGISFLASTTSAQPQYNIISLGQVGEFASGGQGVSTSGNFAAGFTVITEDDALLWSDVGGTTVLPDEPTRDYSKPWSVNDAGTIVGIGAQTFFGSGALPVMWKNGTATALPLPAGQTLGRAYSVNNAELAVGSVGGGSAERAATFTETAGSEISQTMPDGGILTTAYGVNHAGRIVGQALDPVNAAVIRGFYLDPGDGSATDIEALPGHNSAIAFAVSSNGLIAGVSSFNAGVDSMPFLWEESVGMTPIPLPAGTSTGSARGVNADGWAVGTGGGLFAVPFLNDGTATYRLQDLIPTGSGWDLATGTSNGAFGIADDGTIVGRGLLNGEVTGFVLTRVPEPGSLALMMLGLLSVWRLRRV
jgi:uncharacterized membrane protein